MRTREQIHADYQAVCTVLGDCEMKLYDFTAKRTACVARVAELNTEMAVAIAFAAAKEEAAKEAAVDKCKAELAAKEAKRDAFFASVAEELKKTGTE